MAVHTEQPERKPKVFRPVSETRKVRKPLMERKRRERINCSLEQLALLLKEAKLVPEEKPIAKMEKADILELTVSHLTTIRKKKASATLEENSPIADVKNDIEHKSPNQTSIKQEPKPDKISLLSDKKSLREESLDSNSNTPSEISDSQSEKSNIDTRYVEGFGKCLEEVREATEKTPNFKRFSDHLFKHLETCLSNLSSDRQETDKTTSAKRPLNHSSSEDWDLSQKKKRRKSEPESNKPAKTNESCASSELTLVPMQLNDGRVAFIVQGDANLLTASKGELETKIQKQKVNFQPSQLGPKQVMRVAPAPAVNIGFPNSNLNHSNVSLQVPSQELSTTSNNTSSRNLLKIYPNIKTVKLPIGSSVNPITPTTFQSIQTQAKVTYVPSLPTSYNQSAKVFSSQNVSLNSNLSNYSNQGYSISADFKTDKITKHVINNTETINENMKSNSSHLVQLLPKPSLSPTFTTVVSKQPSGSCKGSISVHWDSRVSENTQQRLIANPGSRTELSSNPGYRFEPFSSGGTPGNCANSVKSSYVDSGALESSSHSSQHPNISHQITAPQFQISSNCRTSYAFPPTPPPSADQCPAVSPLADQASSSYQRLEVLKPTASPIYQFPAPESHWLGINAVHRDVPGACGAAGAIDDDEFIDVENVAKDDYPKVSNSPYECQQPSEEDMWRPW